MKNKFTRVLAIVLLAGANVCWNPASAQTTFLLKDLVTDMEGSNPGGSYPDNFTTINGVMYFAGRDRTGGPNNGHLLYKTDGTPEGTKLVKILQTPVSAYGNLTNGFTNFNGTVFFVHKIQVSHYQLWKTDGTEAGTEMVKAFTQGGNSDQARPQSFTVIGNTMYFFANNGNGVGLWKTDGTTAGTVEVTGISGWVEQMELKALNGKVYFSGMTSLLATTKGLYSSNGPTIEFVKNIPQGTINTLTVFNNDLYFTNRGDLWKSDGTTNGTVKVAGATDINSLLIFKNELYAAGTDLYKIDGTTNPVIATGTGKFTGANSNHFFTQGGYKSDGTAAGTVSIPYDVKTTASFYVNNNKMYTGRADSGTASFNLWETDGTIEGTRKYPTGQINFGIVNNRIIFLKYVVSIGIEPHYMVIEGSPAAPAPPSDLTATATNSIELNWQDNSADEHGFSIEYTQDTVAGNWTQITSVDSNLLTYLHTGLNPGEDYFYRVRAYNSTGNSAYSNIAGATAGATGIADIDHVFDALTVYPNPANEVVTINNCPGGSTMRISDVTGKVVYQSAITNEHTITINMADFVSGIYLIRLEYNGSSVNKKLIVNK